MATDFSSKEAFLQHVADMLPDDAHYFEFTLKFNSRDGTRPAAVPGARANEGLLVRNVDREVVTTDGKLCRYTIEGQN